MFTGDKQDYDIWEVIFLGYMALQGLKETILPSSSTVDSTKNKKAYADLVMLLDEKSLSMGMPDAIDDDRKEDMEILRDHNKGTGNPRILTLYNNMCNMKYIPDQGLTEYISRAERPSSLKNANETVSDSLLISMVLKGLLVNNNNIYLKSNIQ